MRGKLLPSLWGGSWTDRGVIEGVQHGKEGKQIRLRAPVTQGEIAVTFMDWSGSSCWRLLMWLWWGGSCQMHPLHYEKGLKETFFVKWCETRSNRLTTPPQSFIFWGRSRSPSEFWTSIKENFFSRIPFKLRFSCSGISLSSKWSFK